MISQLSDLKCNGAAQMPLKSGTNGANPGRDSKSGLSEFCSSVKVKDSTSSELPDVAFATSFNGSQEIQNSNLESRGTTVAPKSPLRPLSEPTVVTPTSQLKREYSLFGLETPQSPRQPILLAERGSPTPAPTAHRKGSRDGTSPTKRKAVKALVISPFFSPPASAEKPKASRPIDKKLRQKGGIKSCIPFPPLHMLSFGLLQEQLAHDPFRLLIGVTFLNRTKGKDAIPVFFSLMEKYPTPADILAAPRENIINIIHHLGLQVQRAKTYQKFAHFFLHDPPVKGKRYRVDHYPSPGNGMDINPSEVISDDDPRVAWEIGHMTKGRYTIDSWRIFCRDIMREEAKGWNGEGRDDGFQPEWMRVLPQDKELIACLRWMWLKEGFEWDPITGEKDVAGRELMEAAIAGRIAWDDQGGMRILADEVGNEDGEDGVIKDAGSADMPCHKGFELDDWGG